MDNLVAFDFPQFWKAFTPSPFLPVYSLNEQEVQGLQAFAFCVVTVNDEHLLGSKESLRVKFKDGICTKLCFKLWF